MPQCVACGEANSDRARFCSSCAALLAGPITARDARKTVTIVFSDLSGSTTLGERLDPETLRDIMSRYFDEMSAVIARHGGTVEKFIGDAIMAVFGIPQLHEDDAVRAVRAASEMRARLASLNVELQRDWAVTLAVRTGVNTGEVVAGDPSAGQRLVTGDTVNVAARLEQAAVAGEILIGEGTWRLVRDAIESEPVSPLVLKGKATPVKAHRLLHVARGAPGRARRLDSPMVGRNRERELLDAAFAQVISERSTLLVTVLGAAGVGKSRLVAEFIRAAAGSATVLQGRCLHYGEGITYWPLLEAIRAAAEITDNDSQAAERRKIVAILDGEADAERVSARIFELLGMEQGVATSAETFWAIRRLFEAIARLRPLIVHFDDLHWGEPTFYDLVGHLARQCHMPIMLLCVARPELLERRADWGQEAQSSTIKLEALTESDSAQLIANLLGSAQLAPQAQVRIASAAEGNPLFVEEMLSMLIDDGLLRYSDGQWVPAQDLSTVAVPASIQALLAARLDRLGPGERVALEGGSVEGQVFHSGAVRELSDDAHSETGPSLASLTRKELIRPDVPSFAGEDAFRFRHILIRDAAYEGMPKKARAELHERFAAWLERVAGDRAVEFDEIVGYHLERSFRLRIELGRAPYTVDDVARRAAAHLEASGRRAYDRGDMPAGVNLLSRAAGLSHGDDRARLSLLADLARGYFELGRFAEANGALAEVIGGARAIDDHGLEERAVLLKLFNELFTFTDPVGGASRVRDRARRAIAVSSQAGDERALGFAWSMFGITSHFIGQAAEAEDALRRAIELARNAGDRPTASDSLGWLPMILCYGPTPVMRALAVCAEMRAGAETGRLSGAGILEQEANLWAMRGDFLRAKADSAAAFAVYRDLGLTMSIASSCQGIAQIDLLADDPAAAESALRSGEEALLALGESGSRSTVAALRGEALYRLGRYEDSVLATETSEALAWPDDVLSQVVLRSARGKSLARLGDLVSGERLCRDALTRIESCDWINVHADTLVSLAEVLGIEGTEAEATARLREALALYERKENLVSARKVRALLADRRSL